MVLEHNKRIIFLPTRTGLEHLHESTSVLKGDIFEKRAFNNSDRVNYLLNSSKAIDSVMYDSVLQITCIFKKIKS